MKGKCNDEDSGSQGQKVSASALAAVFRTAVSGVFAGVRRHPVRHHLGVAHDSAEPSRIRYELVHHTGVHWGCLDVLKLHPY